MSPIDLSYSEIDALINEISSGGKIIRVKNSAGNSIPLYICHCSLQEKLYAKFEYDSAYFKAIEDGFYTAEEAQEEMRKRGFFTEEDENTLESLYTKKKAQEEVLKRTTRVPMRINRVKEIIDSIDDKITELLIKKQSGLEFSAERRAQEMKYIYITWRGVKDPITKEFYWRTKEDFDNETDLNLRTNALVEVVTMSLGMDASVIRYIARSNLWRIRYITSMKTGASPFGIPVSEYTVDQLALLYWSNFYQSVYDMLPSDRPTDNVIKDDVALDAYMEAYLEEQEREASDSRRQKKSGSASDAWNHGDVLVMRSNPDYDKVIYTKRDRVITNNISNDVKLNNKESAQQRHNIRKRRKKLREHLKG